MKDKRIRFKYRKDRTRRHIRRGDRGVPRLCVRRSLKYFYVQVIDDVKGVTVASASSRAKEIRGDRKCSKNMKDAKIVGQLIAEKALKAGVERVVFDRGGHIYHGRVKVLADAARQAGLKF
ncbi:MAG: 50S ribosomal protein L18 [Elusimicrobiota bacterium]